MMTDAQIEAALHAVENLASNDDGTPRPVDLHDPDEARGFVVAALEAAEAVAWQPIAEAPKDGTEYWVLCGAIQFHAKWNRYDDGGYQWQGWVELYDGSDIPEPTHYRNLPEPPK